MVLVLMAMTSRRWTCRPRPLANCMAAVVVVVFFLTSSVAAVTTTTQVLSTPLDIHKQRPSVIRDDNNTTTDARGQCPMGCQQCTASSLACVNIDLNMSSNLFKGLRADTFGLSDLRRLEKLDLSDDGIETLEAHSLSGLASLRELVLSGNKLNQVNWSLVFMDKQQEQQSQLAVMNLSRNAIDIVKTNAFGSLGTLRLLDLSANIIVRIDNDAFQGLNSLLVLDLSDNLMGDVQGRMFRGLDQLTQLSLRGNRIRTLDSSRWTFGLANLRTLDLSLNAIQNLAVTSSSSDLDQEDSSRLTRLELRGNNITSLPAMLTRDLPSLQTLDLSANPIRTLNASQFAPGLNLRELLLDNMVQLVAVLDSAFADLPNLHLVNLSSNIRLKHLSPRAFGDDDDLGGSSLKLQVLDLSNGGLETLHGGFKLLKSLANLKHLSLANNRWRCDCGLSWISSLNDFSADVQLVAASETRCWQPARARNESVVDFFGEFSAASEVCAPATIVHHSERVSFRLGSTALLECQVVGDPVAAIKWVTPRHEVLHWYPKYNVIFNDNHPSFHDASGAPVADEALLNRVQVLRNGNLFIGLVERSDAGAYLCTADNALGAPQSVKIAVNLDYDIIMHVKVVSILVGVATSIAFLLAALVARLVEMILNRFGWCCCCGAAGRLPPKAKHIKKMLESVEHYKKQQLDRLRDNYTMQVQRIKDNCNQQMERIRESYTQQTDRFKDIRDYGTQQLNCMRDQYCDQIKRVREYGVQQMSRVRENYVFQRNRVRKFRAHQLFKLRENYKVQQMHLNKILENMNLESCRTVCARTDSIVFTSETMESSAFVGIVHGGPMNIDGGHRCPMSMMAPSAAAGIDGHDILLSPFNFEMFDFASIDEAFPIDIDEDDEGGSMPTLAFITPPQSPLTPSVLGHDDDDDEVCGGGRPMAANIGTGSPSSSSNDSFADFDELVTCVVIPKSEGSAKAEDKPNTVIA